MHAELILPNEAERLILDPNFLQTADQATWDAARRAAAEIGFSPPDTSFIDPGLLETADALTRDALMRSAASGKWIDEKENKRDQEYRLDAVFSIKHPLLLEAVLDRTLVKDVEHFHETALTNALFYTALMLRTQFENHTYSQEQQDQIIHSVLGHGMNVATLLLEILKRRPELAGDTHPFIIYMIALNHDLGGEPEYDPTSKLSREETLSNAVKESINRLLLWQRQMQIRLPVGIIDGVAAHHYVESRQSYPYIVPADYDRLDGAPPTPLNREIRYPWFQVFKLADVIVDIMSGKNYLREPKTFHEAINILDQATRWVNVEQMYASVIRDLAVQLSNHWHESDALRHVHLINDPFFVKNWDPDSGLRGLEAPVIEMEDEAIWDLYAASVSEVNSQVHGNKDASASWIALIYGRIITELYLQDRDFWSLDSRMTNHQFRKFLVEQMTKSPADIYLSLWPITSLPDAGDVITYTAGLVLRDLMDRRDGSTPQPEKISLKISQSYPGIDIATLTSLLERTYSHIVWNTTAFTNILDARN